MVCLSTGQLCLFCATPATQEKFPDAVFVCHTLKVRQRRNAFPLKWKWDCQGKWTGLSCNSGVSTRKLKNHLKTQSRRPGWWSSWSRIIRLCALWIWRCKWWNCFFSSGWKTNSCQHARYWDDAKWYPRVEETCIWWQQSFLWEEDPALHHWTERESPNLQTEGAADTSKTHEKAFWFEQAVI